MMEERVNAKAYVSYFVSERGISVDDLGVAPIVVLSWHRGNVVSLAETHGLQLSRHWIYGKRYPLYSGKTGGQIISIAQVPIGAPATVTVMEEMVASGARVFLGLGLAGSLQPEAPVGSCIIPTSCIREEGTSMHYVGSDEEVGPSPRLVRKLQLACKAENRKVLTGRVWTTDAPYRETSAKIDTYARQGVLGVDMETSAMYAIGQLRTVEVCNLLVVSDELWNVWNPAFHSQQLHRSVESATRVISRCLSKMPV